MFYLKLFILGAFLKCFLILFLNELPFIIKNDTMSYHQIKSRCIAQSLVDSFVKKIKIREEKNLKSKENVSKGRILTFCQYW